MVAIHGSRTLSKEGATEIALISRSTLPEYIVSYWPYLWIDIISNSTSCTMSPFEIVVSVANVSGEHYELVTPRAGIPFIAMRWLLLWADK